MSWTIKTTTKLRRDVAYMGADEREDVGFVTHGKNQKPKRPTIFVSAMCRTKEDRLWFDQVLKIMETVEVPR